MTNLPDERSEGVSSPAKYKTREEILERIKELKGKLWLNREYKKWIEEGGDMPENQ